MNIRILYLYGINECAKTQHKYQPEKKIGEGFEYCFFHTSDISLLELEINKFFKIIRRIDNDHKKD